MEAALLATYPSIVLPERWRPGRGQDPEAPSLRRLVALVEHLPPGNALERAEHPDAPEWSSMHQLVDDARRAITLALGVDPVPPPHPISPHASKPKRSDPARAKRLAEAHERARRRRASFERG